MPRDPELLALRGGYEYHTGLVRIPRCEAHELVSYSERWIFIFAIPIASSTQS